MVKLRVAVRIIPESQYLNAGGSNSTGTLMGEKRLMVIVRNPDEHYYIGTLAREVQERYKSLYKHDLAKIKYIKDNEDDCDLDPEQLVYDLLIDEGKAAVDSADQHVTIKLIQEQGGALRAGSVIPDLTPIHYQPRPRPPVPKFPTQPVLGKRAGTYGPHESSSGRFFDVKKQRLAGIDETQVEHALVDSIETDASGTRADRENAEGWQEIIPESQMRDDHTHFPGAGERAEDSHSHSISEYRLAEDAGNFGGPHSREQLLPGASSGLRPRSTVLTEQHRARSASGHSSEYYSPSLNLAQIVSEDGSADLQRSASSGRQPLTNGLSLSNRFAQREDREASRAPITPPSDWSRNGNSIGKKDPSRTSFKSRSPGLRASSSSSKKFKVHNTDAPSDIEDTQMSPRSRMKQPFKLEVSKNASASSRAFRGIQQLMNDGVRGLGEKPSRNKAIHDFNNRVPGLSDDEDNGVDASRSEENSADSEDDFNRAAHQTGNIPGRLFAITDVPSPRQGNEASNNESGDSEQGDIALEDHVDVDNEKENQNDDEQIVEPGWSDTGFGTLQRAPRPKAQQVEPSSPSKEDPRAGKTVSKSALASSSPVVERSQPLTNSHHRGDLDIGLGTEIRPTKFRRKVLPERRKVKKSAIGDLSSFEGSQSGAQNAPSQTRAMLDPQSAGKRTGDSGKHFFTLEVSKRTAESSSDISVLDSPGEQLSGDLEAIQDSALNAESAQGSQNGQKKSKARKRKSALRQTLSLGDEDAGGAGTSKPKKSHSENATKSKPKKATATEQKDTKSEPKPKATIGKEKAAAEGNPIKAIKDLEEVASNPPEGSMDQGFTDSPKIHKHRAKLESTPKANVKNAAAAAEKTKRATKKSKAEALKTPEVGDSHPEIVAMKVGMAAERLSAEDNESTKPTKTDVVLPPGVSLEDYIKRQTFLRQNPAQNPQILKAANKKKAESIGKDFEAHSIAASNAQKSESTEGPVKKPRPPKRKKTELDKAPELPSTVASTVERSEPSEAATQALPKGNFGMPSETFSATRLTAHTPSIGSSSRKSLPTTRKVKAKGDMSSRISIDYDEAVQRAQATIRPRATPDGHIYLGLATELNSSPLRAIAPPIPPASAITNRNIKALRAGLNMGEKSTTPSKLKVPATKEFLAAMEADADENESSEAESEDDEEHPAKKKPTTSTSAVPDPAIRDMTPSSGEDDGEEEEL